MALQTKSRVEPPRVRRGERGAFEDGVRAGALAGLCGLAVQSAAWAAVGFGPWLPLKAKAAAWMGPAALVGGGGALAVGLLTHLFTAAFWGVMLAAFAEPRSFGRVGPLAGGALYGACVWAVMVLLVIPAFCPPLAARIAYTQPAWLLSYLVYGAALGPLVVMAAKRRARPAREAA